jgi:hypothetical protein
VQEAINAFLPDGGKKDRKYSLLLNKIIYLDELGYDEKSLRALEAMEEETERLKKLIAIFSR